MSESNIFFQPNYIRKKSSNRINRLAPVYNKDLDLIKIKETFYDELFYKKLTSNK